MDVESASLTELEGYLRSFGGRWASIPEALTKSIRQLQPEDAQWKDAKLKEAIAEARVRSYEHAIREFAKVCKRANPII